jgi:VIT1/CCC1 family predicted Fe2+/Mn2+ transporter
MNGPAQRFVIVDLRIPFFRLVAFFVKAALAAIPAAIIVGALIMLASAIIVAVFGGGDMGEMMGRWRL